MPCSRSSWPSYVVVNRKLHTVLDKGDTKDGGLASEALRHAIRLPTFIHGCVPTVGDRKSGERSRVLTEAHLKLIKRQLLGDATPLNQFIHFARSGGPVHDLG